MFVVYDLLVCIVNDAAKKQFSVFSVCGCVGLSCKCVGLSCKCVGFGRKCAVSVGKCMFWKVSVAGHLRTEMGLQKYEFFQRRIECVSNAVSPVLFVGDASIASLQVSN